MESIANWVVAVEAFVGALQVTEWVGFVVLAFALIAFWTGARGSRPGWEGPSVRVAGLCALAAILLGIWVGISVHLLLGACLLALGCGLSFWSLLLWFKISWRGHIRPGMLTAFLVAVASGLLITYPVIAVPVFFLVILWSANKLRRAKRMADQHLKTLTTRALALTKYTAAAYFASSWFQRFAPAASNLALLSVADRARTRAGLLPRARPLILPSDVTLMVAAQAEALLDQRLRTDRAAHRRTSWIRVLTRELLSAILHRTGIVALFRFLSDLVLAVPPSEEENWAERARLSGVRPPEVQTYVMSLVADMPMTVRQSDVDALRERLTRDAETAGPDWLEEVASHAERWKEETPNEDRDVRIELVGEVIWSVYESAIGPRPFEYDLYDQLRLQAPELAERSSVRSVELQDDGTLILRLNGLPRLFHELGHGSSPLMLQTREDEIWYFRQLETDSAGVALRFGLDGQVKRFPRLRKKPAKPVKVTTRRKAAASAWATATGQ